MNKYFIQFIQMMCAGLDILMLNVIFLTAYFFYRENIFYESSYAHFNLLASLNFSWLFFGILGEIYSTKNVISFELFLKGTSKVYCLWLISVIIYLFFVKPHDLSRSYVISILIVFGVGLLINRFTYLSIRSYFKRKGYLVDNVLIIGYNDVAKKLTSYLESEDTNTAIIGFCEEKSNIKEISHYPIISSFNNVIEVSQKYRINQIYSTISPEDDFRIIQLMKDADKLCIHFKLIPDLSQFIKSPFYVSYLNDIPIINLRSEPLSDLTNRLKKRFFDLFFSLFVLLFLLSWLFPLIALLIKLTSKGPIIYTQNRLGRDNKIFKVYKFRTMNVTESDDEFKQASKDDERVTKVGKFLRKSSLDEVPQFFNVLKGQMSISGPRPHPLKLNDSYKELIEAYMARHFLKPGITGWAQVNGYRGETKSIEKMKGRIKCDIWYMENWSLWLDIKIVFMTIYSLIHGEEEVF